MPSTNIDHLTIPVPGEHFDTLVEWYKKALSPSGRREIIRFPGVVGMGSEFPDSWIAQKAIHIPSGFHFAFSALSMVCSSTYIADSLLVTSPNYIFIGRSMADQAAVDAFHKAATDIGAPQRQPGLRPEYYEQYYTAYVLDPIRNNMELGRTSTFIPLVP
jgi:hypothetical protein